jgi:hypothetical protein
MSDKSEINQRFTVSLSASGFAHLPTNCYENNFTSIVGSRNYFCPSFFADFLSLRISRLRSIDSTICEFVIETRDAADYFDNFILLCRGSRMIVEKSTLSLFRSICFELGNFELFFFFVVLSVDLQSRTF